LEFRNSVLRVALPALTIALCAPGALFALINPRFTPVDLVRQSKAIARLELKTGPGNALTARAAETLRGEVPANPAFAVDPDDKPALRELREAFGGADTAVALLFTGDFSAAEGGADLAARRNRPGGALIVGTAWFGLFPEADGGWRIAKDPLDLRAVWAGSAEMLERAVRYILADSRAEAPARAGAEWSRAARAGAVSAPRGCLAADLEQAGKPALFVFAESGDRLFSLREGAAAERTLPSASRLAAWTDPDADGRLDLASWDGASLKLFKAADNGALANGPAQVFAAADCRSLHATDIGLVLGMPSGLLLASLADGGGFETRAVAGPAGAELGPALPADFNADGWVDVVQTASSGLLFYRGNPGGKLDPPVLACEAEGTGAAAALFDGDFDADGLLDVVAAAGDGPLLFWNTGGGAFREVVGESGEMVYIGKPDVRGGAVCDINNDGRQDILLTYAAMEPQIFFNRGFRCFGYARPLEPDPDALPAAAPLLDGQRGGAVADFDGDGRQDAAFVTSEGEVVAVFQKKTDDRNLGLTVILKGATGPVNVTAWDRDRCLGAQAVRAGGPVFFGKDEPGPLRVEWRFPGKPAQSKEIVVLKAETLTVAP